jgi:hypothetical protein
MPKSFRVPPQRAKAASDDILVNCTYKRCDLWKTGCNAYKNSKECCENIEKSTQQYKEHNNKKNKNLNIILGVLKKAPLKRRRSTHFGDWYEAKRYGLKEHLPTLTGLTFDEIVDALEIKRKDNYPLDGGVSGGPIDTQKLEELGIGVRYRMDHKFINKSDLEKHKKILEEHPNFCLFIENMGIFLKSVDPECIRIKEKLGNYP